MEQELDQQFVEYVVKALVDHPEDVRTERSVDEMGVLITLYTHAEDMGKVIGRSGNTAKALRILLRVVGAKHKARVNLKIYEPEGSFRRPSYNASSGGGNNFNSSSTSSSADDTSSVQAPELEADDDFKL